ncbi:MAG TPA: hypothetical protein DDW17_01855 [Deltaproteobacteria bacterium]|nr:hypothetical protein [Deltaproteobacteria bacterium]
MDTIGIDIGTVSIKYVRCSGKGTKITVVSKGEYAYSGDITDLEVIFSEIAASEGTNNEIVAGITSEDIVKKTFTIPILPKKEQKEVLNWSTTKILSVPLEDMVYEHVMLGEVDEKGVKKEEVLFVGARKQYANTILAALRHAGFRHISLITDIAFTYFQVIEEEIKGSVALIDVGGRRTGIFIFDAKNLMFAREILTASESFTDSLMSATDYSYDNAAKYIREKGLNDEFYDVLRMPFERLEGEIQRTFSVYNQRYPDKQITKVFLAGRGAKIPQFFERLKETMIEETDYLPAPREIEVEFIPAYTLCMDGDIYPNLLPEEVKASGKEQSYVRWLKIGSAIIFPVLLFLSLGLFGSLNKANITLSIEKANLAKKQDGIKKLSAMTASSVSQSELSIIRSEALKKDVTFITLIKFLSSKLPRDVYVKSIDFVSEAQAGVSATPAAQQALPKVAPQIAPQAPAKTQKGEPQKPASKNYNLTLKGYILGEPETLELTMFDFIIALKKSGFIRNVEVTSNTFREMKGRKVIEFSVNAKVLNYEI